MHVLGIYFPRLFMNPPRHVPDPILNVWALNRSRNTHSTMASSTSETLYESAFNNLQQMLDLLEASMDSMPKGLLSPTYVLRGHGIHIND